MSAPRQLDGLRRVLALGLLATFAVAPRLWLVGDVIGPVPVGGGRSPLPSLITSPSDAVVLGMLVVGLLPMLRARCRRRWIVAWGALLLARAGWDRLLWQPYLLHEAAALLLIALVPDGAPDEPEEGAADGVLDAQRLLLVLIYVCSGLAKLHHRFLVDGPTMVEGFFGFEGASPLRFSVSLAVALGEAVGGLLLLFPASRRIALWLLVAMHAAILAKLGPWADGHNPVVWPWNLVMVASLGLLFGGSRRRTVAPRVTASRATRRFALGAVVLLFGVGPALSYVGAWDVYLSFRLYAVRYPETYLLLQLDDRDRLPDHVQASILWEPGVLRPARGHDGYLSVPHWAEQQVGAFAPASHAVTSTLARRLLATLPPDVDATVELRTVPNAWNGTRVSTLHTRAEFAGER